MASGFEIIDGQIRTQRDSLGEIKKRELGLVDALSTGNKIENVSMWLQEQLGTIKEERTEVERSIERLEREKAAIEAHTLSSLAKTTMICLDLRLLVSKTQFPFIFKKTRTQYVRR
jgi:hypothetical protein